MHDVVKGSTNIKSKTLSNIINIFKYMKAERKNNNIKILRLLILKNNACIMPVQILCKYL